MGSLVSKPDSEEREKREVEPILLSEKEQAALEKITGNKWTKYGPVAMAALGALPWVGAFFSIAGTVASGKTHDEINKVMFLWVQEHEGKLKQLSATLNDVFSRFESFGDRITERLESEEYKSLVRQTFKQWDEAETLEKKLMLKRLITNAGGTSIVTDDKVRLFLHWIEKYDEMHFKVMAEIYKYKQQPNAAHGISRKEIWIRINGEPLPRDDSPEGNLYKLLIYDLSTGEVIGQYRETNSAGQYLSRERSANRVSGVLQSPFEDREPYVLTPLGEQFVRYVMEDLTPQLGEGSA